MRRIRVIALSVLALLLVVGLAACSSSTPKGSLKVTLNGLPSGVAGKVIVTGPGGYAQTVTSTTTLSVAPGAYSVTVLPTTGGNPIVPVAYDGAASSTAVTVTSNATASSAVNYAVRVGSGHLWLPQWNGSLEAESYASGSLAGSGSPPPDVTLGMGGTPRGEAIAFDHAGNMWVADCGGYAYRYDAAQLASSGTPTPAVAIDATAYVCLGGLAFDASGDLWATSPHAGQVLEFTPAQLSTGGVVTPAVVLGANATPSLSTPIALAFDASGDLWIGNLGSSTVVEFTPSQLNASGSPTPTVTLSANATLSLSGPEGMAFDASGNLWVANNGNATVVRFDAALLGASGSPTPAATIASGSFASGAELAGMAFDASGNLWVGNAYPSELLEFMNPDALSGSVATTPAVTVTGVGGVDAMGLAFSPPPADVPIRTP